MVPTTNSEPYCSNAPRNIFFCVAALAFIAPAIILENYLYFIGTGIFYLLNLCEAFCCGTAFEYMTNVEGS